MWKKLFLGEGIPVDQRTGTKLDRGMWGMLAQQLLDFKYYYILGLICLFITHYIQSQLPVLAKEVAELIGKGEKFDRYTILLLFAVGIIVFRTLSRLFYFFPARVLERDFRLFLVKRMERSPPFRYHSMDSGDIFQTMFSDVEQMRAMVGFAILQLGNVFVAGVVLIPQISAFHPKLVLPLLPMLLASMTFTIIVAGTRKYARAGLDEQAKVQNALIETYNGKETIKNFHAEKSFIKNFNALSWSELMNFYRAGIGIGMAIPLIPLGVGISLLWGALVISQEGLGASSLIYFSGMTFLFLEPLAFISWIGVVFVSSGAAWKRIKKLVVLIGTKSDKEIKLELLNPSVGIEKNIIFWDYNLSFHFEKNQKYCFVAPTGHGKTEVLKQIAALFKLEGLNIGYVAQSPYVFDDTLEKNLFLGSETSNDRKEKAYRLLEIFGLNQLEDGKNNLFQMSLGENGKRLSGGQIKRMCLVRSLLLANDVIIWDDPFSSVDLILEREIIESLDRLNAFEGKIVIFSTHRLGTLKFSDKTIFLNKEKGVVEQGDTKALLESCLSLQKFFEEQIVK